MHPNNPEQRKITGFSRLLVQTTDLNLDAEYPNLKHSGIWMSKDRNWLIAPTSGRASYQLLPISQDAGIRMSIEYKDGRLIGSLEDILKGISKLMMYTVLRDTIDN